ncbi:putative transcription factor [Nematocida displodere]|uniref:Putative transcription factor n=1 Tax=Nematocida displodere TaxID=1805483 RepID=A0A177EDY9_9MICR|nr:putative transcription factor [Nematocida displodere]
MVQPTEKKSTKTKQSVGVVFDTKVVTLTKTAPYVPKAQTIPGVSSSVHYNPETDTVSVTKFPRGFGKAVRAAREKLSLTQKQLATKVSKPLPTIFAIEKEDAMFDKDLIAKLEKVLQIVFDPKLKKV